MAEQIGEAVLKITIDDKEYQLGLKRIGDSAQETTKQLKSIGAGVDLLVFKELAQVGYAAFKAVAQGIVELGQRGADIADVSDSFEILTTRVGGTAETMLGALRQGTVGTISDFELMKMANTALGAGLIRSAADMQTLSEGARALGKATGVDTKSAFETLTSAIASGRTAQLKQLGLFVDSKVAVENFAAAQGKSVSQLTDAQRAQALSAATLDALHARLRDIKPDAQDFGELINAGRTAFANFTDKLAVGISQSPVLRAGMLAAGQAIQEAFGKNGAQAVSPLVDLIERVAIFLGKTLQVAIMVGAGMAQAFELAKVVFNNLLELIFEGIGKVTGAFATVAEKMAQIPVIGEQWKPMAGLLREQSDQAKSLAFGFGEVKTQAALATYQIQNGADSAVARVQNVIDAMEAQRGKAVETTKAQKDLGDTTGDPAPKTRAIENSRAIADAYTKLNADIAIGSKQGLDRRLAELDAAKAAEIQKISEMKDITQSEITQLTDLVVAKYAQQTQAAIASGDEIKNKKIALQGEIALLEATDTQARQLQLDQARQREIDGLLYLKANYLAQYTEMVALVNQKYDEMKNKAQQVHIDIVASSTVAKDQQILAATAQAEHAKQRYSDLLHSGKASYEQLEEAHKKYKEAEKTLDDLSADHKKQLGMDIAAAASQILTSIFGKNKAAAIAAAIIDTASAVTKTLAQLGWWGIPMAAAIAAKGYAQVQQIRAQSAGFKEGTPGLDFMGFGKQTPTVLHGREAVIPQGKGHLLAREIAGAMPGQQSGMFDPNTSRMADSLDNLPRTLVRAWRQAMATA